MDKVRRISLSRKGFDSSAGGRASPVIDGQPLSLPIPEAGSGLFYNQLHLDGTGPDFGSILRQLGATQYSECHMDPNLNPGQYGLDVNAGWAPAFGQDGNAASQLISSGFHIGDIFLFFGRFRNAELRNGQVSWLKSNNDFHLIFGFLEVGEVVNIRTSLTPEHIVRYGSHPHVAKRDSELYTAKSTLYIPAQNSIHGFSKTYGLFRFHHDLVLTEPGQALTSWCMPSSFRNKHFTTLGTVPGTGLVSAPGRGQELIGTADANMLNWLDNIIKNHSM